MCLPLSYNFTLPVVPFYKEKSTPSGVALCFSLTYLSLGMTWLPSKIMSSRSINVLSVIIYNITLLSLFGVFSIYQLLIKCKAFAVHFV